MPEATIRDRGRARPRRARAHRSGASGGCSSGGRPSPSPQAGERRRRIAPGLARVLSTAFLVALLAATAAAFALTERREARAEPDLRDDVPPAGLLAGVQLRHRGRDDRLPLRKPERAHRLDEARRRARAHARRRAARSRAGLVPLAVRRHLRRRASRCRTASTGRSSTSRATHRTIELPNAIALDTERRRPSGPAPRLPAHLARRRRAQGRLPRPLPARASRARAILLVDGRQVVRHAVRSAARRAALERQGRRPRRARPGNHVLKIAARGRGRQPREAVPVRGRARSATSALGRDRVLAQPRRALRDPRALRRASGRPGASTGRRGDPRRPGTLRLKAPRKPGVYRLYVSAGGHAAKALVVGRRERGARARRRRRPARSASRC